MTEFQLLAGLHGLIQRLKDGYAERVRCKDKHPPTIYVEPQAYKLFTAAMQIVNRRIGIAAPQDGLYQFRGIKLRCEGGKRDNRQLVPVRQGRNQPNTSVAVGGRTGDRDKRIPEVR